MTGRGTGNGAGGYSVEEREIAAWPFNCSCNRLPSSPSLTAIGSKRPRNHPLAGPAAESEQQLPLRRSLARASFAGTAAKKLRAAPVALRDAARCMPARSAGALLRAKVEGEAP